MSLLPFSFFKAGGQGSSLFSPALVFHTTVLVTFVYIFSLRLRRNFLLHQHSRSSQRRWSIDE
jgi:hypothetical protein